MLISCLFQETGSLEDGDFRQEGSKGGHSDALKPRFSLFLGFEAYKRARLHGPEKEPSDVCTYRKPGYKHRTERDLSQTLVWSLNPPLAATVQRT